ncbi:Putative GTP-binding protein 6 [Chamberlinius hualienensis]
MKLNLVRILSSTIKSNVERSCLLSKCRLLLDRSPRKISEKCNIRLLGCRHISVLSNPLYNRDYQDEEFLDSEYDQLMTDEGYDRFARLIYSIPNIGHRVFLIQPYLKYGPGYITKSAATTKMIEAHALIETLHNWKVVDKVVLSTDNLKQKFVFKDVKVDRLRSLIVPNLSVSAVFINIDRLSGLQYSELVTAFGLPVYDRYSIVLQIFKDHSRSRISKLQIAIAEIPYLRSRIKWYQKGHKMENISTMHHIGGATEMDINVRRDLLEKRELKLKQVVNKVKDHRQRLRLRRKKLRLPSVAVVGYTNAGKTSLIKNLTDDASMRPVNHLFATLDVTVHGGYLPSRMQVMYVDTVGFISDIPTTLIESFHATLEDAAFADVIIHVRDLSHPETESQKVCVLETLKLLDLPQSLQENIIEVGNKIDLVPDSEYLKQCSSEMLLISATNGTGLAELQREVELKMMEVKGYVTFEIRVPNGGDAFRWLYKETTVSNVVVDDKDDEFLILTVTTEKSMLSTIRTLFPKINITQTFKDVSPEHE